MVVPSEIQDNNNIAGATPVDPKQNGRPSTAKQGLHWFGHGAGDCNNESDYAPRARPKYIQDTTDGIHWFGHGASDCDIERENDSRNRAGNNESTDGSSSWTAEDADFGQSSLDQGKDSAHHRDREERLRLLKEKQNEERQRKLEELKQQALAAQKFREQKEEERRRRLEELRIRDTDRRHQVEERKRQIWEAERDRREAILRKNQEREARIESKRKNERSSIVFAFGSSTPRMLEPGDTGSTYWSTRRATSTTNVMSLSLAPGPLTRRSSERELEGSKKRATSAGGVERKASQDQMKTSTSIYEVFQWGSTPPNSPTLCPPPPPYPVILESVDENDSGALSGGSGGRAGRRKTDLTPTIPSPRESTPGTPSSKAKPKASPGLRSGEVTPSRPQSSMSQHSVTSQLSSASASLRPRTTPRRQRPISIAVTGVSERISLSAEHRNAKSPSVSATEKPPIPKVHASKKPAAAKPETPKKTSEKPKSTKSSAGTTPKTTPLQSPSVETEPMMTTSMLAEEIKEEDSGITEESGVFEFTDGDEQQVTDEGTAVIDKQEPEPQPTPEALPVEEKPPASEVIAPVQPSASVSTPTPTPAAAPTTATTPAPSQPVQPTPPAEIPSELAEAEMTSSVIAKTRITTEEEAKAALAERRRQAREQAEREAELERQRLEAERLAEEERLRKEEEEQRRMEEEQLRLLEEARKSEELRLQQAILEAQKREEEERKRKEEELRLKIEKEEAERKAKEEAEKLRQEMELRLKKEEEDRQARRKRVEAIMLRTRGKGNTPTTTPTKDGEEAEESPLDETKVENSVKSQNDQFLNSERSHSDANSTSTVVVENIKQNGHHNGSVDSVTQNNVTNSLLDLNPVNEPVGQILDLPSGNGKIADTQIQPPFIAFQEKKEPPTVNDLLS